MTPTPAEQAGQKVVEVLQELGHEAVYAGGCVRDRLLGRRASDVDIATSARPNAVRRAFRRTNMTGEQFAVVRVRLMGEEVEVATFRGDEEYHDGRRPSGIRYADAVEDAARRDFTINGLFYDPIADEVQDFVGGQQDLRLGLVRAIGDPEDRFAEDRLRILRAPRFAAALGFRLEPATAEAARRHAPEVTCVSQERIHIELAKILESPARARGVRLCGDLGLLEVVLPAAADGVEAAAAALAALPRDASLPLAWAALLHGAGPAAADAALAGLRSSNKVRERAVALLEGLETVRDLPERPVADQKRSLRPDWTRAELPVLVRAVALAGDGDLEPLRYLLSRQAAYAAEDGPAAPAAAPLVRGADLKQAGLPPGERFGRILRAVEDAQLEGRVADAEAGLALALGLAPP